MNCQGQIPTNYSFQTWHLDSGSLKILSVQIRIIHKWLNTKYNNNILLLLMIINVEK